MEEKNVQLRENKMGVMPVNKLLITMSLPMMVSMLVQALYNIVDSIFVAQIDENALTAVSLAFPLQTLMIAIGGGTGVGVNALLSKALGEREFEKANKAAINGVFLAVVSYIIFLAIGLFAVTPFYLSQTQDVQIINYGTEYMTIVCCCSFGMYTQFIFERLLQSTGKTFYTMITQGTGAIINIILDPIFIFGYLGVPAMGVAGAAVATVIGQVVAGIMAVIINQKKNTEVHLRVKGFKPDARIIKSIYVVGLPSIIMQSIGSVMTYGMNQILMAFTSTAAAVFGVYFKLQSFIFMPIFGLNNGMVPIIAYNYGAGKRDRLLKTMKQSILYAVGIMIVGFFAFQVFPTQLFSLFEASETMLAIGVPALRIISLHFLLAGFCIIIGSVFQALGNGVYSMFVSMTRQLVVLLPAAWFLSKFGDVNLVWFAFPIAEIASLVMTVIFFMRINKSIISKIGQESVKEKAETTFDD
ncbi:MAG: MATE family efflux transporter [Lachnospiraceae bacterium]|nr:MATE family efflux transporter [Lachnospiraceae bacterium]